jgi:predicted Fe-Mo cluster-binding NifX family protein
VKVAIAATENNLSAPVDPHFGRCTWFCIFDTETRQSEFVENPAAYRPEHAGCEAANLLISSEVGVVVAYRFGAKVVDLFRSRNIQMVIPSAPKTISEIFLLIR